MFDIIVDISEAEALDALAMEAEQRVRRTCIEAVTQALPIAVASARLRHPYRDRTGELTKSIGAVRVTRIDGADGTIEAIADHASYIEGGTRPHDIYPKHRRALRWFVGGDAVFARHVRHPGTRAMPFIEPASDVARDVIMAKIEELPAELQALFDR